MDRDVLVWSRLQLATALTGNTRHCTACRHRAPTLVAHCMKCAIGRGHDLLCGDSTEHVPSSKLGQLFDKNWRFNSFTLSGYYTVM